MTTVAEIVRSLIKKRQKPGDMELRKLPDRIAMIHGRLSGFRQVKDSKESVKEIAYLVDLVKADGYQTGLESKQVEEWLVNIQSGKIPPGVLEDGQLIVNCLGLGISGSLSEDKRKDLDITITLLEKKGTWRNLCNRRSQSTI